jgi:hypothetical protein
MAENLKLKALNSEPGTPNPKLRTANLELETTSLDSID